MFDPVLKLLRQYDMLQPGDTLTCAVSGGADSMALLWCMYMLREKLDIHLQAAHFNHHLRGEESDRDEAFVRSFCDRFEIPLILGGGQVEAGKKGLEAAAREARYRFLESIPGKLATAHTADDNAETVLMHLVRGTGLKGLGGIAPVRGRILRPMLTVTRQQVVAFLQEYCLSWVEDSSNAGDDFLRNRLRHSVMPLLKEENPRLAEKLSSMALRLREDEAALEVVPEKPGELSLPQLESLPKGLQNRLIAEFLKASGVKEPDSDHISLVRAVALSQKPSAKASLPGGIVVQRRYDRLVTLNGEQTPAAQILPCPGRVTFGNCTVVCEPAEPGEPDAVCPVGVMTVRSRKSGDSLRLPGGSKTLKKLYIDRKIPADRRPFLAVVADEAGVLAVESIGLAEDRKQGEPAVRIKFL